MPDGWPPDTSEDTAAGSPHSGISMTLRVQIEIEGTTPQDTRIEQGEHLLSQLGWEV